MKKFKLSDVEFRRLLLSIVTNDLLIDANCSSFLNFNWLACDVFTVRTVVLFDVLFAFTRI